MFINNDALDNEVAAIKSTENVTFSRLKKFMQNAGLGRLMIKSRTCSRAIILEKIYVKSRSIMKCAETSEPVTKVRARGGRRAFAESRGLNERRKVRRRKDLRPITRRFEFAAFRRPTMIN